MNLSLLAQVATSDWALFFGRFHPLIVHLPIGFLLIAALLELDRLTGRQWASAHTITLILFWSAVSATLACVFGLLLAGEGGYNEELLDEHRWQGIAVAVFAWAAWALRSENVGRYVRGAGPLYGLALVVAVLALLAAGHHGGALTHGEDYLTQHAPQPLRSLAGLPEKAPVFVAKPITDVQQAEVYTQIVNPILQTRCVQCHNAGKQKGDLRMDTKDFLLKGGEGGPILVAGKSTESEMLKRCLLPLEDENHMPPKGKEQLTDEQLTLLGWWIDQGAPFDKKVAELAVTDVVKPALATLGPGAPAGSNVALASRGPAAKRGPAPPSPVLTKDVPTADPNVVAELKKAGLLVLPISKENNQLEVSAVNVPTFSDAQAALLPKLAEQLVWLKLGDTQITDATLAQVAKLKNLQKLHLDHTKITDAGLRNVVALPYLEYLNLYGTAVTDAGLQSLASAKTLRSVYLWQTSVTEAGAAKFRQQRPEVELNVGVGAATLAEFAKATAEEEKAKAAEKKK